MILPMEVLFRRLPIIVSLLILGFAVIAKGQQLGVILRFQYMVFDIYQQQFPREYEPAGVKIIDIDEASLQKLGQWPWPRQVLADLIYQLTVSGAAAVAFDSVFAEADRTSPISIAEIWHAEKELTEQLFKLPDHDEMMAEAISQGYIVTGYVMDNAPSQRKPAKTFGMSFVGAEGSDPSDYLLEFQGATLNLPAFEEVAEGNGFFNNTPDPDGIVRRVPLALSLNGEVYFSLAMEALRVGQGASSYLVKMVGASGEEGFGESTGITHIRNGHFEIPTDANGNFLIHYTGFEPERYISAWEVLEQGFDKSLVEGEILFLGTSAHGLKDLRATPLNPSLPGVEVHVQALEQVLLGKYLYRPDWILFAEVLAMIVVGLGIMVLMARLPASWGALFLLALLGVSIWFSVHMFRTQGFLIDPVTPGITILALYMSESLRRYLLSEAERKHVRGAFSQYMSPALVEELAKNPDKLTLGGQMKDLTVLFCDVRGFTTISERFDAEQLTTFINRFLTPMTDVILDRKGTIDKYMGDCIMAFWNAPLDDEKHARHACDAALRMFETLNEWNEQRKVAAKREGWDYFPVEVGVGLNSGEVCVGNMGSEQRFDYSVLGDDVNLASRLEGQSKTYGVDIVIGQNTQALVPEMACVELDQIKVKGKTEAVTIYALLGDESVKASGAYTAFLEYWGRALQAYRTQRWNDAEQAIALCRAQHIEGKSLETLFELYETRIASYRGAPPPEDWGGVFVAKTK